MFSSSGRQAERAYNLGELMNPNADKYAEFVEHPRYGCGPRLTGCDPSDGKNVFFHWHSGPECRIPNTAIAADTSKQVEPTVAVTHYFDVIRTCRDCSRKFLFFAEEQKYWYETLGFGLDSDCVRCVECRKSEQQIARWRERYDMLLKQTARTESETLELIDSALSLIEVEVFGKRTLERTRALLNSFAGDAKIRERSTWRRL